MSKEGHATSRRGVLKGLAAATVAAPPVWAVSQASSALAGTVTAGGPELPPATEAVTPLRLHVPQSILTDLRGRLGNVRWPGQELVTDWSQGVPLRRLQKLTEYWRTRYDWRRLENRLNAVGQYRTLIDGVAVHFLHARSPHRDATPIILSHGWPGSVVDFLDVIEPLTDPTRHGGRPEDAFHVVVPSLPGFGFSGKPEVTGWNSARIAKAWIVLMRRLGYQRYITQGGDWGGCVATFMGKLRPRELAAVHLNFPMLMSAPLSSDPTPEEQEALAQMAEHGANGAAFSQAMRTEPQTWSYGLTDSPVGLAGWIYEKLALWSDSGKNPEGIWSYDQILDTIMMYWVPDTVVSAARLYWEGLATDYITQELDLPVGVSVFPKELYRPPRIWGERVYRDLRYWNKPERGGHFAAFEQPELFTEELRRFVRVVR
ncbi:hydrolase [Sphaerisporangium siamense]|uniref:Pimeloyl-ACP methyl ester carboxylesterase n=1 Tax=Sphaerisporangium siamense TaxID=795645 RepID=A0A7W7DCY8_9ACTN|nr:epoxide hydrolase family protein [Sphaerisporangium siamense]MBB4703745.1 pimeloyl-ACP methyl ester carboxylesterase [Sphaerisporangium siamense]GII82213.1 hydrolase [Sphaerisporangium siamense]